jgi:hypothetical protein
LTSAAKLHVQARLQHSRALSYITYHIQARLSLSF